MSYWVAGNMIKRIAIGALCLVLFASVLSCRQKQAGPAKGRPDWSAMKEGMTQDQVRAVLGEPKSTRTNQFEGTFWDYSDGTRAGMVRFDNETGRVTHWNAP
jgi:outer membrane protein assembly factor BamE (lipoprotein component of BamABCDE complex)